MSKKEKSVSSTRKPKKRIRKCFVKGCSNTDKDGYVNFESGIDLCTPCYEALIGKNTSPSAVRNLFLQRRGVPFSEVQIGERFYDHKRNLVMKMPITTVAVETDEGTRIKHRNAVIIEAITNGTFSNGDVAFIHASVYCEITRMDDITSEKASVDKGLIL